MWPPDTAWLRCGGLGPVQKRAVLLPISTLLQCNRRTEVIDIAEGLRVCENIPLGSDGGKEGTGTAELPG
jgi:hypothetical protein